APGSLYWVRRARRRDLQRPGKKRGAANLQTRKRNKGLGRRGKHGVSDLSGEAPGSEGSVRTLVLGSDKFDSVVVQTGILAVTAAEAAAHSQVIVFLAIHRAENVAHVRLDFLRIFAGFEPLDCLIHLL